VGVCVGEGTFHKVAEISLGEYVRMEESWKTSDKENCQNDEFLTVELREI
jgi:hypothetical protein